MYETKKNIITISYHNKNGNHIYNMIIYIQSMYFILFNTYRYHIFFNKKSKYQIIYLSYTESYHISYIISYQYHYHSLIYHHGIFDFKSYRSKPRRVFQQPAYAGRSIPASCSPHFAPLLSSSVLHVLPADAPSRR